MLRGQGITSHCSPTSTLEEFDAYWQLTPHFSEDLYVQRGTVTTWAHTLCSHKHFMHWQHSKSSHTEGGPPRYLIERFCGAIWRSIVEVQDLSRTDNTVLTGPLCCQKPDRIIAQCQ